MHNSLIKLVDISLIPASIMVVGKVVGLLLSLIAFNIPWSMKQVSDTFFSLRPAVNAGDIVTVATYSDLFMYLLLAGGFTFVLIQATKLHDSHIQPSTLIKLSNHNLLGLVKSSFDIYHTASIWLIFLWMSLIVILVNVITAKTMMWLLVVALLSNVALTTFLLQDVYKEINLSRKNLGSQSAFA